MLLFSIDLFPSRPVAPWSRRLLPCLGQPLLHPCAALVGGAALVLARLLGGDVVGGLLTRQAIDDVAATPGGGRVLFMLDEFANMGKLAGLSESLTLLPGLGVRVWMIVQSLDQLRTVYGREATNTILSQAEVQQFFAVQDLGLAKMLSDALGQRTVKTTSINLGRDEDDDPGESRNEAGRPLMSPDEIRHGEQPRPSMVAEFNAVQAHLQQVAEARDAGQSADREVRMMVSEPSLIFMAWLDRLLKQRASGDLRVVGPDIDLDRPVDMEGAMRFLAHTLVGTLEEEMAALSEGRHHLLFPSRSPQPEPTVH